MTRTVEIRAMMQTSGVGFGTSGARGLVSSMTDAVCCAYTLGFLQALRRRGEIAPGSPVGIAGDRRSSTGRILNAIAYGVRQAGHTLVHAGRVPSPAIALLGLERCIPTLMVTGSHIPDDRNGIKFNKTTGEILKEDEAAIVAEVATLEDDFDAEGQLRASGVSTDLPETDASAASRYVARWVDAFPKGFLKGKRIVVFGHSAVGRELLLEILGGLGAETIRVGWSEQFIPVDTEAIRPEDVASAREWAKEYRPFAIVSTDGDSDRPLVSDESGKWLRGDVLGVLTARFLNASAVVTPISSNTVVERSGAFRCVSRTRIGSPYVIAAMNAAVAQGHQTVVGYEANGGFLTATPVDVPGGGRLSPLPTRDPVIVMLSVLAAAAQAGCTISALEGALPGRATASGRIKDFPNEISRARLAALQAGGLSAFNELFAQLVGEFSAIDLTDGIRGTAKTDEIIHLRASGNAPELRCYAEADNAARADALSAQALELIKRAWL